MNRYQLVFNLLLVIVVLSSSLGAPVSQALAQAGSLPPSDDAPLASAWPQSFNFSLADTPTESVVVRLYVQNKAQLDAVAGQLDIWEANEQVGYVVVAVSPAQYEWLDGLGYRMEIDAEKTAQLQMPLAALDPRYYYFDPDYPNSNGRYIVNFLQTMSDTYPSLVELIDIGDAWQALHGGYHRDLWVLRITNENPAYGAIDSKPTFFLFANIHAREVAVPELAIRYIKYLTEGYNGEGGYGVDPDVTWLVNHNVVYLLVMQNPDGHRVDEANTGASRRKNLNNTSCPSGNFGIDLNRNHSFLWNCCGGSSGNSCDDTYRGVSPASEPETQAFQNYFATVIQDQNGPNDDNTIAPASPLTTTGIFISLHSYSDLTLWPWGFSDYGLAPNDAQMATIGHKFATYTGYTTFEIWYDVDGATDDWTYGKFGIPSYTFEVGSSGGTCGGFFPPYGCIDGIDGMPRNFWAENKPAFIYAHKIARTPYVTAYGPDTQDMAALPVAIAPGASFQLQATVADNRLTGDPVQNVAAAEYFVDAPGADGTGIPMSVVDGAWDETSEMVTATVSSAALPLGQHYILVHGQSATGAWGPFTAIFVYVVDPAVAPVIVGEVRDAQTNAPLPATITAGAFGDATDPATGYYSMTVISGTYNLAAVAADHVISTVVGLQANDYQAVHQDFYLHPLCAVFTDDVESGNQGWTAQTPWAITTEASHSSTHSWTDSPGGSYSSNRNVSLTSPVFNLSNYQNTTLSFWHIYNTEACCDFGYVEYSTNGGSTWASAASYGGTNLTWTKQVLYIPALDGQANARIRFRFYSDSSSVADGWHVDDIVLSGGGAACSIPLAPSPEFASNSPVALGQALYFANQTLGTPPLDYWWDFGDGLGYSTQTNPLYVYPSAGLFTVTLVATNTLGSQSVSHQVFITPPIPLEWNKWINDQPWSPGISITAETSDTIEVADVISTSWAYTLSETWNSSQLSLVDYQMTPTGTGAITVGEGTLQWTMPASTTQPFTLTKIFALEPCTWTQTTLGEALTVGGILVGQRPLLVNKLPPILNIDSVYLPLVTKSQLVTFTLFFSNTGGYENNAMIRSVFPPEAVFVSSTPTPTLIASDQSWVEWDLGDLAMNEQGDIQVSLHITESVASYSFISITNGIYDHVGQMVDEAPIVYMVVEPPSAGFVPSSHSGYVGAALAFTNTTTGLEPIEYLWDFGDGITTTLKHPAHIYTVTGTYVVSLTATDIGGSDVATDVIAVAAIPTYTLEVRVVGEGEVTATPDLAAYVSGTQVMLQAQASTDWRFADWSGDLVSATNPVIAVMDEDKVITATFEAIPTYTLEVRIVGNGTVTPTGGAYLEGQAITLTAAPDPDWYFVSWSGDVTGTAPLAHVVMDADKLVTATFAIPTYTLEVRGVGQGVVMATPDLAAYMSGTQVMLQAQASTDWRFADWSGDLMSTTNPVTITMNENKIITATFEVIPTHTLTVIITPANAGEVLLTPSGGVYTAGTLVQLTAVPSTGWQFTSWSGDLVSAANPLSITLDANKIIMANFRARQYRLYLPMTIKNG